MTIHFHCECGQRLKASEASIGQHFDCPICGAAVIVPEFDEAATDLEVPVSEAAAAAGSQPQKPATNDRRRSAAGSESNGRENAHSPDHAANDTVELSTTDTRELKAAGTAVSNRADADASKSASSKSSSSQSSSSNGAASSDEAATAEDHKYRRDYTAAAADSDRAAEAGSSADTARNLYKLVRKMNRGSEVEEKRKAKRPKKPDEEQFEFTALLTELGRTFLPGVAAIALFCFLAYWIASSVMSTGRELPELGDVAGVVTLDDAPLAGATVTFLPFASDDSIDVSRVSSSVGVTDDEGRYELNYVKDVSGAAVGTHQVIISVLQANGRERLPRRYNYATELGFEVQPGSNTADFALKSK